MAVSKQAIKGRIKSISATRKITGAMELIAISKVKRQRTLMENNAEYASSLKQIVTDLLNNSKNIDNPYLYKEEDTHPVTIVFCSDIGLCGGYNINMLKAVSDNLSTKEEILFIGKRNRSQLIQSGYSLQEEIYECDSLNYEKLSQFTETLLQRYLNHEITSIKVFYTRFVNSMNYEPTLTTLLPMEYETKEEKETEIIYEPDANVILNDLVPLYVKSQLYTAWLQTTTSEQSSRRMAMDQANDNAEELIEQLTLQFNQARQASITQEITEIVSGADAL